ncbi:unnamed protein product [Prunus brigantina]
MVGSLPYNTNHLWGIGNGQWNKRGWVVVSFVLGGRKKQTQQSSCLGCN